MHSKKLVFSGKPLEEAVSALIMLHGRGGSARDIISLASHLDVEGFALIAPQAENHTWYPYSFLAPPSQNEPWLSSALALIKEIVNDVRSRGLTENKIYFLGFSQGACLALEFVARNAARYGGVAAFTGGLIGDSIYKENYNGDFSGTPVFIGSSDPDPHVPVDRVSETVRILRSMNADVIEKIYPNMGHTINQDEIDLANTHVFGKEGQAD